MIVFEFNQEKDLALIQTRGVGFDDVISAIKAGNLVADIDHFNQHKYPNQRIFILRLHSYIYIVPYVYDRKRDIIFLKTIYANRKLQRKFK